MVDTDDTRRTMDAGRRTTPRVWHKLPTGELKSLKMNFYFFSSSSKTRVGGFVKQGNKNKAYRPNAHLLDIFMQPKYQFEN